MKKQCKTLGLRGEGEGGTLTSTCAKNNVRLGLDLDLDLGLGLDLDLGLGPILDPKTRTTMRTAKTGRKGMRLSRKGVSVQKKENSR